MIEQAEERTRTQGTKLSSGFIEKLAEKLGATSGATSVYGSPIERDGVTIVPVAKVRWGLGGGGRGGRRGDEENWGGGGGVQAVPVGFIELKGGEARFRPIRDTASLVGLVVVGGLMGMVLLRRLSRLVR